MATHFMDDNTVHFCKEFATGLHPVAKGNGKTQHHLAVGDQRQHVVHQMIGGFSLAFGATRWTPASFLATKRHYFFLIATITRHAKKSISRNSATQIGFKLIRDVQRQRLPVPIALPKERPKMAGNHLIAGRKLWATWLVGGREGLMAFRHPWE